jgi:hypothetical protein
MRALLLGAALALAGCGTDSSSGAGTADSPFVGTYRGSSVATVTTPGRTRSAREGFAVFVNRDGLVQLGSAGSTIYASGPLRGDRLDIAIDAGALVDPSCSGIITLTGVFSPDGPEDKAIFEGRWSSRDLHCFGTAGELDGPITAQRTNPQARASRVFETNSPALQQAFQQAAG